MVGPRRAASFHADALAVFHPGGDPDLDLSLPLFEARALARRARVDDAGPTALAVRAREQGHEALDPLAVDVDKATDDDRVLGEQIVEAGEIVIDAVVAPPGLQR